MIRLHLIVGAGVSCSIHFYAHRGFDRTNARHEPFEAVHCDIVGSSRSGGLRCNIDLDLHGIEGSRRNRDRLKPNGFEVVSEGNIDRDLRGGECQLSILCPGVSGIDIGGQRHTGCGKRPAL